ncbi:MAG: gamma-glutamylcyclotransferase family protein [Pseudomonadota bacterium]
MAQSIKWLFVYGTLLSRSRDLVGRDMRLRLANQCLMRRPARVAGLLYDLGGYPGWRNKQGSNRWISGEVLLLKDPAQAFAWLDPYENFDPTKPDEGEYERVVQGVLVCRRTCVRAWIYNYRGPLDGAKLIDCGQWLTGPPRYRT